MRRLFLLLLVLSACSDDTRKASTTSAQNWTVTEVVRIGDAEGGGPKTFGQIFDITLDNYQRIYVLDQQAKEIRVFDSAGNHVRTLGRAGQGPGEFSNPIGMTWDPSGRLWVIDVDLDRYSVFDTTGTYVTSHPRKVGGYGLPWPGGFDRTGNLYEADFVTRGGKNERVLIRYEIGKDITPRDTFAVPQREEPYFSVKRPGSEMFISIPFMPSLQWVFDGNDGIIAGGSEEYLFVHRRFSGDTVRVIQRESQPIAVTDADITEALERRGELDQAARTQLRTRIPDTKPVFDRFIVDDQQRVWVFRTETAEDAKIPGRPVDIFNERGEYSGSVTIDVGVFPVPRVIGSYMVGVARDDLDVPYVVLYRIGSGS